MSLTFLNYTPHPIKVFAGDKQTVIMEIPPQLDDNGSKVFIRVAQTYTELQPVGTIPVARSAFGDVQGLPEPQTNVYLIVSLMVAQALPDRTDLLVPDTNVGAVRDANGAILGTTRFLRV